MGHVFVVGGAVLLALSCAATAFSLTSKAAEPRGALPYISDFGRDFVMLVPEPAVYADIEPEPFVYESDEQLAVLEPEIEPVQEQLDTRREFAASILAGMTQDEKLYQLFFVTPEVLTGYKRVYRAGSATEAALKEQPVGGLIYTSWNIETDDIAAEMVTNTKGYAAISMFMAADGSIPNAEALGFNATHESLQGLTIYVNPKDLKESVAALEADLRDGKISQSDIDDAVLRILLAKLERGIITD